MNNDSEFNPTLELPSRWISQSVSGGAVQSVDAAPLIVLSLTLKMRQKLAEDKIDLHDMTDDFSDMLSVDSFPDKRSSEPIFTLTGSYYRVFARESAGKNSRRPIAVVQSIKRLESLPRRGQQLRARIAFDDIWEERHCDLQRLLALCDADEQPEVAQHKQLHGAARRTYGALRSLMVLLEQRATVEQAAQASGQIVSRPNAADDESNGFGDADAVRKNCVVVKADTRASDIPEDSLVELCAEGQDRGWRTKVLEVDDDAIVLEGVDDVEWTDGQRVAVTVVPRFAMRQHSIALRKFLDEDVEGNWEDLARLLCTPDSLSLTEPALPDWFFCDHDPKARPLNVEQRRAVAGAIRTPHAFFIQGPPGTGKTTVITEIVQQLIARGERVLMLAPTHVAVDEVLRRVGHKDGVLALRLSWDDAKVRDDLRCFTLREAGRQFVRAIRRPSSSRSHAWVGQIAKLDEELQAIQKIEQAMPRARSARDNADIATKEVASNTKTLADWRRDFRRQMEDLGRELAKASTQVPIASQQVQDSEREVRLTKGALELELSRLTRMLRATEGLDAAVRAEGQATNDATAAKENLRRWEGELLQTLGRIADRLKAIRSRQGQLASEIPSATERERAAEAELSDAKRKQGFFGKMITALGIGAVSGLERAHRDAMAYRQRLEQERSTLSSEDVSLEQQQLRANQEAPQRRRDLQVSVERTGQRLGAATDASQRAAAYWVSELDAITQGRRLPQIPPADLATWVERLRQAIDSPERCESLLRDLGLVDGSRLDRAYRQAVSHHSEAQAALGSLLATQSSLTARHTALQQDGTQTEARLSGELSQAQRVLGSQKAELDAATTELQRALKGLGYATEPTSESLAARRSVALARKAAVRHYPDLEHRWFEMTGMAQAGSREAEEQIAEQIGDDLLRAANLVCATTVGVAGRAGQFVRDADFDTLIVDEASRVTDSEFLIGAVRAKRWILVGDEKQLPPYVEQDDEHHLHAMAALHRVERGASPDLQTAVNELADLWNEDEELHQFRSESVLQAAERMRSTGSWTKEYRDTFIDAHEYFQSLGDDADREMLRTMLNYLVRSLFERCVDQAGVPSELRQRLAVQRRMIEPIAAIVRDPIYQGEYRTPDAADLASCGITALVTPTFPRPVVFLDTSSQGQRARDQQVGNGFINPFECEWISTACRCYERELRARNEAPTSVSILCFYRAQAREIRKRLGAPLFPAFHKLRFEVIDAIDRIQGQESDLVFISFCRTHGGKPGGRFGLWLQDLRRLNVACTRAHRGLVLVGHRRTLEGLCSFEESQRFYQHLLQLFEAPTDPAQADAFPYMLIRDFEQQAGASRRERGRR